MFKNCKTLADVARVVIRAEKTGVADGRFELRVVDDSVGEFDVVVRFVDGKARIYLPDELEDRFFDMWGDKILDASDKARLNLYTLTKGSGLPKLLKIKHRFRLPMFDKVDVGNDYRFISVGVRDRIKVSKLLSKFTNTACVSDLLTALELLSNGGVSVKYGKPSVIYNNTRLIANSCMSNKGYDLTLLDDMGLEVAYIENSSGHIVARALVDRREKLFSPIYDVNDVYGDELYEKLIDEGYRRFDDVDYKSKVVNIENRFIPYMDDLWYFIPTDELNDNIGYFTNVEPEKGDYVGVIKENNGKYEVRFVFYDPDGRN